MSPMRTESKMRAKVNRTDTRCLVLWMKEMTKTMRRPPSLQSRKKSGIRSSRVKPFPTSTSAFGYCFDLIGNFAAAVGLSVLAKTSYSLMHRRRCPKSSISLRLSRSWESISSLAMWPLNLTNEILLTFSATTRSTWLSSRSAKLKSRSALLEGQ